MPKAPSTPESDTKPYAKSAPSGRDSPRYSYKAEARAWATEDKIKVLLNALGNTKPDYALMAKELGRTEQQVSVLMMVSEAEWS